MEKKRERKQRREREYSNELHRYRVTEKSLHEECVTNHLIRVASLEETDEKMKKKKHTHTLNNCCTHFHWDFFFFIHSRMPPWWLAVLDKGGKRVKQRFQHNVS